VIWSPRHSTPYKEDEENKVAIRDDTKGMSTLRRGVIGVKLAPILPPTAGARRKTNKLEIRMTATIAEKKDI